MEQHIKTTSGRHRILVIDDEDGVRRTICENLEACGFEVLQATDGEAGMALIDPAHLPKILITDLIMPRQEGIQTISMIRKSFPSIKIVAISGGGRVKAGDYLRMAKNMGADLIFAKPLDLDELEKAVIALAQA